MNDQAPPRGRGFLRNSRDRMAETVVGQECPTHTGNYTATHEMTKGQGHP
jgi:hypothetical protein